MLAEGNSTAAAVEARRVELAHGSPTATVVRVVAALAAGRVDASPETLAPLATNATLSSSFRSLAAFHLAASRIRAGQSKTAVAPLRDVFLLSAEPHLFPRAAYALHRLAETQPADFQPWPSLPAQIAATASLWTADVRASVDAWFAPPAAARPPLLSHWVVCFYRSQINPAIGQRCAMVPSCSEYYRQAARKHGFLTGTAMVADRFFREPDHAKYRIDAINVNGREKYLDPLGAHDFWFTPRTP